MCPSHSQVLVQVSSRPILPRSFTNSFRPRWRGIAWPLNKYIQSLHCPTIYSFYIISLPFVTMRFAAISVPSGQTITVESAQWRKAAEEATSRLWVSNVQRLSLISCLKYNHTQHKRRLIYTSVTNDSRKAEVSILFESRRFVIDTFVFTWARVLCTCLFLSHFCMPTICLS